MHWIQNQKVIETLGRFDVIRLNLYYIMSVGLYTRLDCDKLGL